MAQQSEKKEETSQLQIPETLSLTLTRCVNNCGFYGSAASRNMCQSCYHASAARIPSPPSSSGRDPTTTLIRALEKAEEKEKAKEVKRCFGCRKRVGLLGFRCRCGELFCGGHRYSDRHVCGFDYRAAGQEAISRENPVVKAAKIVRI